MSSNLRSRGSCPDLGNPGQRGKAAVADALALHAAAAEGAVRGVGRVVVAENALADAAEVALHGMPHVPQGVPPEPPVAARVPALPPVHPRRRLWHVLICRARPS